MTQNILNAVTENVFGVWFLIGAALVFFMQCGFAMVETGFTRAKNAGNIILKNLMDFCIGAVVFVVLGFGLMMGEEVLGGFCGLPTLDPSRCATDLIIHELYVWCSQNGNFCLRERARQYAEVAYHVKPQYRMSPKQRAAL